jgi:hypothetical protein
MFSMSFRASGLDTYTVNRISAELIVGGRFRRCRKELHSHIQHAVGGSSVGKDRICHRHQRVILHSRRIGQARPGGLRPRVPNI